VLHSCWCIFLFECGLNSNSYLNSNFVRNRKEKEIEKEPKIPAQTLSPSRPSAAQVSLLPLPSRAAQPARHLPSPRDAPARPKHPAHSSPPRARAHGPLAAPPARPPLTPHSPGPPASVHPLHPQSARASPSSLTGRPHCQARLPPRATTAGHLAGDLARAPRGTDAQDPSPFL